jgi:hypothetical protein
MDPFLRVLPLQTDQMRKSHPQQLEASCFHVLLLQKINR